MLMIEKMTEQISSGEKIEAISLGVAGTLDKVGVLARSPHLPDWVGKPIKEKIEEKTGAKVFIQNDSALVGLGEAVKGAGKGFEIVVYITVSTGVGGAKISNGKIDENSLGFEPGHQILDIEKNLSLEDLVSGSAFEKKFGKKSKEVIDPNVWEETARNLAFGVYNSILEWSPDVVVLGGPMITGDPAIPLDGVRHHMDNINKVFPKLPEIKMAELGSFGGLYGGFEFLKVIKK
jgi:glucokinase